MHGLTRDADDAGKVHVRKQVQPGCKKRKELVTSTESVSYFAKLGIFMLLISMYRQCCIRSTGDWVGRQEISDDQGRTAMLSAWPSTDGIVMLTCCDCLS